MMESHEVVWPWLLATLVFLILLGTGRTLRAGRLGHAPLGAGIALSAALGVFFYSMLWMGIGHFGGLRAPWPWLVFGLGALLALPGLFWTLGDLRRPVPGLERGFGPRWFAGGAWFLLIAALSISFLWISGVTGYGGIGFLFERSGLDYAVGHTFYAAEFPRDPFLGDEPLELWLFGLGAPIASLALTWWLGVAILFGVCGLGWRLHRHGSGLAAAAVLAVVLFASDRLLFLAPALPAALAIVAVLVLAVESRGRPHLGRTLVAGMLGGFALISDLGALAMLAPLLLFGPAWCKKSGLDLAEDAGASRSSLEPEPEVAPDDRFSVERHELSERDALDAAVKLGAKKWLTPARHVVYGLLGLSLPLLPWLARNEAWLGDPCYGFDSEFFVESDYRFYDADRDQLGHQPTFRLGRQEIVWGGSEPPPRPRVQYDPIFIDYDLPFGADVLDEYEFFDRYLYATEWGLGIGLAALFAPWVVSGRRRRERALYLLPGLAGTTAGAYLGDFEATTPSAIALLSVSAGQALYDMTACRPSIRTFSMGGALATGGLALGLSGAHDCGYWGPWSAYPSFPQFEFSLPSDEPLAPGVDRYDEDLFELGARLDLRYDWYGRDEPASPEPQAAADDDAGWGLGLEYKYDYGRGLQLDYRYELEDDDAIEHDEPDEIGPLPSYEPLLPGEPSPDRGVPQARPGGGRLPGFQPDPDVQSHPVPRTGPSSKQPQTQQPQVPQQPQVLQQRQVPQQPGGQQRPKLTK